MGKLVCVLVCAAVTSASSAPAIESKTIFNGVLVNPVDRIVYLMDSKLGVIAVDLATGKQRWAQRKAVKPLVAAHGAVIAADAAGALVVLDAKTGAFAKKCSKIPGVTLVIDDGLGSYATSDGFSDGTHAYVIGLWSSHEVRGAKCAQRDPNCQRASSSGGGSWEIDAGACTATDVTPAPTQPKLTETMDAHSRTWTWTTLSGIEVRLVKEYNAHTLVLHRTRSGTALADVDITEGTGDIGDYTVDTELAHVVISHKRARDTAPIVAFDVETGAAVRRVELAAYPYASMFAGDYIVVPGPQPEVAVFSLVSGGKPLWTRTLRDTRYHGPQPPAANRGHASPGPSPR